jgi:hypothetical protein
MIISGFTFKPQGPSPDVLIGEWKLDMSPQDQTDNNFAMMRIESVDDNVLKGTFYREGVAIQKGQINTQRGIVYGALVSGDNSGLYNTTFYFEDGKLYGSTHALDRNFLSVWIAEKE